MTYQRVSQTLYFYYYYHRRDYCFVVVAADGGLGVQHPPAQGWKGTTECSRRGVLRDETLLHLSMDLEWEGRENLDRDEPLSRPFF